MKTETKETVSRNILFALGIVGMISVASLVMVAPGLAKILPLLSKIDISRINQELKRLHKRGLVEIIKTNNGVTVIKLTKEGKDKLKRYEIDNLQIDKPKKWDGKWRIIIFDIPIEKNIARDHLRRKMKNLGFYKLKGSVFVHPYPCYEVITFIREYFRVKDEVEYIEAERLENQNKLIEYFFV